MKSDDGADATRAAIAPSPLSRGGDSPAVLMHPFLRAHLHGCFPVKLIVIPVQELETHRQLVSAFWSHQAWWLSGSGKDEDDHYQPMHEFGYALLQELARLVVESPVSETPSLWHPVFELGSKGALWI
ncbi:MAG: hypothetical protein IPM88_14035 [Nitrospira sp.]|nr:hypothetical protein [Nitrospira sp.]